MRDGKGSAITLMIDKDRKQNFSGREFEQAKALLLLVVPEVRKISMIYECN